MLAQGGVTPGLYDRSLGYLHSRELGIHGFQSTDQVSEGLRFVPHDFTGGGFEIRPILRVMINPASLTGLAMYRTPSCT